MGGPIRACASLKQKNRSYSRSIRERRSLIFRISMVLGSFSRIKGTWFSYLDKSARESTNKGTPFPYFPNFDGFGPGNPTTREGSPVAGHRELTDEIGLIGAPTGGRELDNARKRRYVANRASTTDHRCGQTVRSTSGFMMPSNQSQPAPTSLG